MRYPNNQNRNQYLIRVFRSFHIWYFLLLNNKSSVVIQHMDLALFYKLKSSIKSRDHCTRCYVHHHVGSLKGCAAVSALILLNRVITTVAIVTYYNPHTHFHKKKRTVSCVVITSTSTQTDNRAHIQTTGRTAFYDATHWLTIYFSIYWRRKIEHRKRKNQINPTSEIFLV